MLICTRAKVENESFKKYDFRQVQSLKFYAGAIFRESSVKEKLFLRDSAKADPEGVTYL
jgi:hypothetical protein